jgi:hypothetical protein
VDRRKKKVSSLSDDLKLARESLREAQDDLHAACLPEPDLPMFDGKK